MENFLQVLEAWANRADEIIWGVPLIALLVLTGVYLTLSLKCIQVTSLFRAIALVFSSVKHKKGEEGEITGFAALCTALASTIGTGNIVGVATAVHMGGPGALFWMFVAAFFGMATKYAECLLGVRYRKRDEKGVLYGGPMYYIRDGVKSPLLAKIFAILTIGAGCFGIGTYCQVNSMVEANAIMFDLTPIASVVIITVLAGAVTFGGLKSISRFSTKIVPLMALFYMSGCLAVVFTNLDALPGVFATIVKSAFNLEAGLGGAAGTGILIAMRFGIARGMFSNEAGLGSAPIAAATARTKYAAEQGLISMTGTFLDTIVICMLTGLVIVISGGWTNPDLNGVALTTYAFSSGLGASYGTYVVNLGLLFFAFTTVIGWNYYAESCYAYLFSSRTLYIYRIFYLFIVASSAVMTLNVVWVLSDVMNGLMALPNLIALFVLRKEIVEETVIYMRHLKKEVLKKEDDKGDMLHYR